MILGTLFLIKYLKNSVKRMSSVPTDRVFSGTPYDAGEKLESPLSKVAHSRSQIKISKINNLIPDARKRSGRWELIPFFQRYFLRSLLKMNSKIILTRQ